MKFPLRGAAAFESGAEAPHSKDYNPRVDDERFIRRALELAERGRYSVSPNPMVGCVIVRDDEVIGEGWHQRAGEPHAEIKALLNCDNPRGATMYVTLEPCVHHGRTGPCSNAIVDAGVSRVVVAARDPHDIVNGRGIEQLRAAGIEVTIGVLEKEARRLNEKFLYAITAQLPFVCVKAAITLDGKLATVTRDSRWITGEAARQKSLEMREEYDAILVGGGTVCEDDPQLTRRLGWNTAVTPWTRVVLDRDGRVPPIAHVLTDSFRVHPPPLVAEDGGLRRPCSRRRRQRRAGDLRRPAGAAVDRCVPLSV